MTRETLASQRAEIKKLKAKIAKALKACDREDRYDAGHGHWISTAEIRAALED